MSADFGPFGGRYVPETLIPALDELEAGWQEVRDDRNSAASSTACSPTTPVVRPR